MTNTGETNEAPKAAAADHIISGPDDDLHLLSIVRSGSLLLVRTNNREMYGKWGTFGFDELMAKQLIEGLSAVLAGAKRAVTQTQLRVEEETRKRELAQPAAIAAYSDLFGDS